MQSEQTAQKPPIKQARYWAFTLNNYVEEEVSRVEQWEEDPYINRAVVGREVGESGTPHLQGFVAFRNNRTLAQVRKILPRAHWEPTRSRHYETYCRKDNDFAVQFDRGIRAGTRTDLITLVESVKRGDSDYTICNAQPAEYVQYFKAIDRIRDRVIANTNGDYQKKEVIWHWGPTGCGKSRTAWEDARRDYPGFLPWTSSGLHWFDGYCGQPVAILDDFRKEHVDFAFLLRLLDGYPLRVPTKGGFAWWQPKRIYITSPDPPEVAYPVQGDFNQLRRRITSVREFDCLSLLPTWDDLGELDLTSFP